MRWVVFLQPGVFEFVNNTRLVDNIRGIEIRYSETERVYDVLKCVDGEYYIGETSFFTEQAVRDYIK